MTYARDRETVRTICGVRITDAQHWAVRSVHAFARWVDETTLTTWCGLTIDVKSNGQQTRDLVSCVQCGQASWDAYWGRR